mgnify:CR=1 FL=1
MDKESCRIFDRMRLHRLMAKHPEWSNARLGREVERCEAWVRKWRLRLLNPNVNNYSKYLSESRAPHTRHNEVDVYIEDIVCDLREELSEHYGRNAGPIEIIASLAERTDLIDEGYHLPTSTKTVAKILKKRGYVATKRQRFRIPVVLPPPNEEWEIDFGLLKLGDGTWFEFFVVIDRGTSRVIYLEGCERYNAETALEAIARLFLIHGCPKRIRMDRDTRFVGAWTSDSYPSALLRFIRNLDVEPIVCPPRRPDLKPFVERVIFTIKHEWLKRKPMNDIADALEALESFPEYYHTKRRHQGRACKGKTPDQAFPTLPPTRTVPEVINTHRWLQHEHARIYRRRINSNGMVQIDKHQYYIGTQHSRVQVLVHMNAHEKIFHFEDGKRELLTHPIQGLQDEMVMDFQSYLIVMKLEARSAERHRFNMWHRFEDVA